jgi:outer membrane protein OmpA-like peptidoglycan-associated protein
MHALRLRIGLTVFAALFTLFGCATPVEPTRSARYPLEFNAAIKVLSEQLFAQVRNKQGALARMGKTVLVIDPFIDANTAEVTETSREIELIVLDEARRAFPDFIIERMTAANLGKADYVISGIIRLDNYAGGKIDERFYRVSAAITDLKTGIIIANAESWVSNRKLKHNPVGIYQESPMYLKDKRTEGYIATSVSTAGAKADREYFASLPTAALLIEADKAYEMQQLDKALELFKLAEARPDGKVMKTYSALYQIYRKQRKAKEAETVFARLVDVGLENNNLSTRFLFAVNSTDFIADPEVRAQYAVWLQQIGRKVAASKICLQVIGHSSRTGAERYNDALSLQRAESVRAAMQKDNPQVAARTTAIGRGFHDNIIGTGSDDAQDAIDRRVEFKVVGCGG